jgi:D-serine dehydratase
LFSAYYYTLNGQTETDGLNVVISSAFVAPAMANFIRQNFDVNNKKGVNVMIFKIYFPFF